MPPEIRNPGPPASEDAIRALEAELATSLPADYRRFLARYNGGRPVPGGFDIRWANPALGAAHTSTEVGFFFSLDGSEPRVLDEYRQYGDELPPGYLAIGADPGGDTILVGLEGEQRGGVYYAIHDLDPEFDRADPATLGVVAVSFEAFLAGLYAENGEH